MQQSSLRYAFFSFGVTQTLWCLPTLIDDFSAIVTLVLLLPGALYILLGVALPRVRAWSRLLVEWPPKVYAHVLIMVAVVLSVASYVLPGADHRATETTGDYLGGAILYAGLGAIHLVLWLFARKVNRLEAAIAEADAPEKMPRVAAMDAR